MYDYAFPSFGDSLLVPVISPNKDSYKTVIHDFEVLMNNINEINPTSLYVNDSI
jgi:hypothetical protein